MEQFFKMDSPFFVFMGRVGDLIMLNILWIVCSIPVITIGASTSAVYYCTLRIWRKEDTYVWKMFFHSFKQNFHQSILLTLVYLGVGALLLADLYISIIMGGIFGSFLSGIMVFLVVILFMMISYSFPLLAQFENGISGIIKSSFVLSMAQFPRTLLIMLLNLLPVVLWLFFSRFFAYVLFIWTMIGTAVIAYINSSLFVKIFSKYIPKEIKEEVKGE